VVTAQPDLLREQIRQAIEAQPQKTVTVLSSLLAVEDGVGYIPPEGVEEVAAYTDTTINDVWAVASFYTNFRFTPLQQHVIEVCWGPTCHLRGAQRLLAKVQEALGLEREGDSPDGQVTLKYNTCLGACSQAPVIAVDHHFMGRITLEHVKAIMARVQEAKPETAAARRHS
jgi:NADH:ubiquinone oxidoreductase subunit E